MTTESKTSLRAQKCANIIMSLCDLYDISPQEATDIFYKSELIRLIEDGVADLQCRSDKYLATLIWDDYIDSASKSNANDLEVFH